MVKLTTDIIERKYSHILSNKSLSKTIKKEELRKLTHLHMNDMFISSIVSYIEKKRRGREGKCVYIYIKFNKHLDNIA